MPKFSVLTPVHLWSQYRVDRFLACIQSIRNQTFKDFEWIVIDDGSTVDFLWESIADIAIVIHKSHEERIVAYNAGIEKAQGEWICFLDSDDEYKSKALEKFNKVIEEYPKQKLFNFGSVYSHKDGTFTFRDPFKPKRKGKGHEIFGPGNIVNGTFIFHRSLYEDLGLYPPTNIVDVDTSEINYGGKRDLFMGSPWDFSAQAQIEFPEIRKYFFINKEEEPGKVIRELGNPWGNDYYLFYKFTRKYNSRVIKEFLYIVTPR